MGCLLYLITLMVVLRLTMQEGLEQGSCECGVFPSCLTEPIIERTLQYHTTCDQEGEEKCQNLCVALAESARDKAPQMICEKLKTHVEDFYVRVYAKTCNSTNWKFTGLQSANPICCHDGNPTPCKRVAQLSDD